MSGDIHSNVKKYVFFGVISSCFLLLFVCQCRSTIRLILFILFARCVQFEIVFYSDDLVCMQSKHLNTDKSLNISRFVKK